MSHNKNQTHCSTNFIRWPVYFLIFLLHELMYKSPVSSPRHAKGKHSSLLLQQEHNTCCSTPHPCSNILGKLSERGAISESDLPEIYPGLWPFPPTAHLGFNRSRWVLWEVNKMTRLLLKPLITNLVYSIWLAHQHKHKSGKQNRNLAQEMCDCLLIVLLGTLFPYQRGPVAQSPGTERKNASYALGKRG